MKETKSFRFIHLNFLNSNLFSASNLEFLPILVHFHLHVGHFWATFGPRLGHVWATLGHDVIRLGHFVNRLGLFLNRLGLDVAHLGQHQNSIFLVFRPKTQIQPLFPLKITRKVAQLKVAPKMARRGAPKFPWF